jgi:thioredoxin reductase
VTDVAKDGDAFVVSAATHDGAVETFRAARVVVAIGRRGTPRTLDLDVEPGCDERVSYALADARSFAGKRVLVVGLGDSAMEAAIALARQPGTTVAVSYRGSAFQRGKARNIDEMKSLVTKNRVRIHFGTVPVAVGRAGVVLASSQAGRGRRTVNADAVLVLIGGEPSWGLLARAGIRRPSADGP